jgi:hypothetical protein
MIGEIRVRIRTRPARITLSQQAGTIYMNSHERLVFLVKESKDSCMEIYVQYNKSLLIREWRRAKEFGDGYDSTGSDSTCRK